MRQNEEHGIAIYHYLRNAATDKRTDNINLAHFLQFTCHILLKFFPAYLDLT